MTLTRASPSALRLWLCATIGAALSLTLLEALLLQKTKAFFTGGFLSASHTSGPIEAGAFLLASALSDAGLVGLVIAFLFGATARLKLTVAARTLGLVLVALLPFVLLDVFRYRLLSYFGEAFDLRLMFELTANRPEEMLAVASPQVYQAIALILVGAGAITVSIWLVNHCTAGTRCEAQRPWRSLLVPSLGLFLTAVVSTSLVSVVSETFGDGLRRKSGGGIIESLVGIATDVDRDGFGLLGAMRDTDLWNGRVYPWAVDVPGNHIDENGVGGDLPAGLPPYLEAVPHSRKWSQHPTVVLFVLESFRADTVGRVFDGRQVTPVLNQLARDGISSSRAYSHNGYTAQSRFHLLSGRLAGVGTGSSLVDDFAANGYETAYFSAQDESFGGPGLGVGFDRADVRYDAREDKDRRYSTHTTPGSLAVSYSILQERIAAFLESRDRSRPLFLYVNFHDTHFPYHHAGIAPLVSTTVVPQSQISPAHKSALHAMYLNTAANVDQAVGAVIRNVQNEVTTAPAVIVTADHGESLFDENFLGHGYALNDVQTQIPLIVSGIPLIVTEPFGQAELREAVNAALSRESTSVDSPSLSNRATKAVFQYLGNIDRPRQIGFVSTSGRTIYDFRTRTVRTAATPTWSPPDKLTGSARFQFLDLIRTWERMMVARSLQ